MTATKTKPKAEQPQPHRCKRCGHVELPANCCRLCGRQRPDWPADPGEFLTLRGWTPYGNGRWSKPQPPQAVGALGGEMVTMHQRPPLVRTEADAVLHELSKDRPRPKPLHRLEPICTPEQIAAMRRGVHRQSEEDQRIDKLAKLVRLVTVEPCSACGQFNPRHTLPTRAEQEAAGAWMRKHCPFEGPAEAFRAWREGGEE